jgi:hypothetical protein
MARETARGYVFALRLVYRTGPSKVTFPQRIYQRNGGEHFVLMMVMILRETTPFGLPASSYESVTDGLFNA